MTADFAGRMALVVGASRGIGAGTARAWAAAGAAVVVAARTPDALHFVLLLGCISPVLQAYVAAQSTWAAVETHRR